MDTLVTKSNPMWYMALLQIHYDTCRYAVPGPQALRPDMLYSIPHNHSRRSPIAKHPPSGA